MPRARIFTDGGILFAASLFYGGRGSGSFNLADYKPADDRRLTVRIVVHPDIADKVLESNNYYMEAIEEQEDGLHVILRVYIEPIR